MFKVFRYAFYVLFAAYFLTIMFPQYLFAHEVSHKNFKVYARQPLDGNIDKVLDSAEARLAKSPIYDKSVVRKVFLTDSHAFYAFLSNKAFGSFANSIPGIDNILVNKSDAANDLVFINRAEYNKRSLSGVIAHEVTHLFIKKKFGWARVVGTIPTWKKEGYCEYVAGDGTLTYEEGIKYLKENPDKPSYFKYYLMVKYLIEKESLSIEDLFNRDFDEKNLEAKVLANL
ncbi:MAG: hypothetical protein LC768_04535 [Acidobacteria bacterium]|nr:hypothetical protein [Acidobacteriota bacterium]MCA1637592.1 hypothetical protein [Acidobacteriota bacterium]